MIKVMEEKKNSQKRTLTDEDLEALAEKIWCRARKEFYLNIGMGVFDIAWKGFVILLIALAAYGAGKHFWFN